MSSQPPPAEQTRVCLGCGRQIPVSAYACQFCGKPAFEQKATTKYAVIGGIFCIISGVFGLITAIMFLAVGGFLGFAYAGSIALMCGAIILIFAILALLGGVFAIQRKNFGMAVVGAVFALLVGYIIFGILAIIFIVLGKDEFQ